MYTNLAGRMLSVEQVMYAYVANLGACYLPIYTRTYIYMLAPPKRIVRLSPVRLMRPRCPNHAGDHLTRACICTYTYVYILKRDRKLRMPSPPPREPSCGVL